MNCKKPTQHANMEVTPRLWGRWWLINCVSPGRFLRVHRLRVVAIFSPRIKTTLTATQAQTNCIEPHFFNRLLDVHINANQMGRLEKASAIYSNHTAKSGAIPSQLLNPVPAHSWS